jgi:glycosyltransferase involved in cell wall biosynthesis
VSARLDLSRIHFNGTLPYADYFKVLQFSRAHVYLTYPFVLSWSMLEAMSAGCLLVASSTPPVEEVMRHGENGLLFPFRNNATLAKTVIDVLADPEQYRHRHSAARRARR